jgi:protein-S-isoprenylcysteine O-methyltransferase Ste14
VILAKALSIAFFVAVSLFVAVPLGFLALANGLLTFQVGAYRFMGLFPIVLGAVLAFWVVLYFAVVGEGTPAPFDPPKRLVTGGLFCYVRNPMYLGAVLVFFGEALFFQSLVIFLYGVFMWVSFHLFVVHWEEPRLKARFGEAYAEYVRTVPRWLPRRASK